MATNVPAPVPKFFKSNRAFAAWLRAHGSVAPELLVGFHKTGSGNGGLTYKEALDEALSYGWIDGIRRRIDNKSYSIRFTPRKPRSIWSAVNIKRMNELIALKRVTPAGLVAFAKRDEKRAAIYSYEREAAALDGAERARLDADKKAAAFYDAQAPWYRRTSAHWVTSAKRAETRARRLDTLIECSRKGERIPPLAFPSHAK